MYCGTNPARWPVPCRGASGKKTGVQPAPTRTGVPASQPAPATSASSQTFVAQPSGASVWGEGSCVETVPRPRPPTPETPMPPPPPSDPHCHAALRMPEASAGPHQPGHLLSSCIKLSPCPLLPAPNVSSGFFSPFLPPPPAFPALPGSAQVKWLPFLPPCLMDHQLTSCFLLFSLCVCLFKLFFLPPPFFSVLPLLPCNWRMCYEFANSWTVRLFFQTSLLCLPSPPLPSFLHSFLGALTPFGSLREAKIKEREDRKSVV